MSVISYTINFLQKYELNIFPDHEMTIIFMRDNVKWLYPSIKIIVDGMQCQTKKNEKPSDPAIN